jgi:hypothetical protein
MSKFIIHLESGTIMPAEECLVFDSDDLPESVYRELTGEPYWDDQVILRVAPSLSTPLVEMEAV